MANEENLMSIKEVNSRRSREEHSRDSSKGGKASGKARRKKKAMRQAAADLLNASVSGTKGEVSGRIKQRLKAFGYDEDEALLQDAMLIGVMMRALSGDVRAAEFIRDTAGDSPALDIRREELKLRKAELEIKRKALLDDSKPDRDENNLFEAIRSVEEVDTDDLPEVE